MKISFLFNLKSEIFYKYFESMIKKLWKDDKLIISFCKYFESMIKKLWKDDKLI